MEASRGGAGEKKCKTDNCKGARFDWKNGLLNATRDPALLVETTDTMTIIKDKYPKASVQHITSINFYLVFLYLTWKL